MLFTPLIIFIQKNYFNVKKLFMKDKDDIKLEKDTLNLMANSEIFADLSKYLGRVRCSKVYEFDVWVEALEQINLCKKKIILKRNPDFHLLSLIRWLESISNYYVPSCKGDEKLKKAQASTMERWASSAAQLKALKNDPDVRNDGRHLVTGFWEVARHFNSFLEETVDEVFESYKTMEKETMKALASAYVEARLNINFLYEAIRCWGYSKMDD